MIILKFQGGASAPPCPVLPAPMVEAFGEEIGAAYMKRDPKWDLKEINIVSFC